jgi:hypothetical protein
VAAIPVLDPAEEWNFDDATRAYRTRTIQTTRTKKVPRNHVKAPATDKHPAQVEMYFEDVIVGTWETVKFSGAITAQRRNELIERVVKVRDAVKFAREAANSIEVEHRRIGKALFDYLLGGA